MSRLISSPPYHRRVTEELGGLRLSARDGSTLQRHLGNLFPVVPSHEPEAPFALAQTVTLLDDSKQAKKVLAELHQCLTTPPHPDHPTRSIFMREATRGMAYMARHFEGIPRSAQQDAAGLMKEHAVLLSRAQQEQVRQAIPIGTKNARLLGVAETLDTSLRNNCPKAGRAHQHTIAKVLRAAHPRDVYETVFATDDPDKRELQQVVMRFTPGYRPYLGIGDSKNRKETYPIMPPYYGSGAPPAGYGGRLWGPVKWLMPLTLAMQEATMKSAADLIGWCFTQSGYNQGPAQWPPYAFRPDSMRYSDSNSQPLPPYFLNSPFGMYDNYRSPFPWGQPYGDPYGNDGYRPTYIGNFGGLMKRIEDLERATRAQKSAKQAKERKSKQPEKSAG